MGAVWYTQFWESENSWLLYVASKTEDHGYDDAGDADAHVEDDGKMNT